MYTVKCNLPERSVFITPEPLNVLGWNFRQVKTFFCKDFEVKPHPSPASADAQMTHFETWLDFTDHGFCSLEWLVSFLSYKHTVT